MATNETEAAVAALVLTENSDSSDDVVTDANAIGVESMVGSSSTSIEDEADGQDADLDLDMTTELETTAGTTYDPENHSDQNSTGDLDSAREDFSLEGDLTEEKIVFDSKLDDVDLTFGSTTLDDLTVDESFMNVLNDIRETTCRSGTVCSPMQISQNSSPLTSVGDGKQSCSGCQKGIEDRYLLKALDQFWHEDCLKCSCCDCRLGEVGSTLFTKANLLLCRRDYLRLFGATGYCTACSKMIPAFELVMKAKGNVYHLECFACQQCNHRFCVGDKFYLCDNRVLCEYDYEERMMFARLSSTNFEMVNRMKKQTRNIPTNFPARGGATSQNQVANCGINDDVSSGYGSPSPTSV